MSFSRLIPPWTLAFLETIITPSVRSVDLDIDFSDSDHLFLSVIKGVGALYSSVIDAQYRLEIYFDGPYLQWTCHPDDKRSNWRRIDLRAGNYPAPNTLETLWAEVGISRFTPKSVEITLMTVDIELPKLDNIDSIRSFVVYGGDTDSLFTYMSEPTTRCEWGLPDLEDLTLYDCRYDPEQLLDMVLVRYGGEGSAGDNISNDRRDRPPPLKDLTICHFADVELELSDE
ncbi:hypothetical protein FRC01_007320 [Tulasnella sp. 417]|nr:hypothetical protein FRC01_007320 [Tulasnella sp. 417]